MVKRHNIAAADQLVLQRVWRQFGTGELAQVRQLSGRSHRTFECASALGPALITRLADPERARFDLEAAVLRRCAESGFVKGPDVLHVGHEETPGGPVSVMVQEKLAGIMLSTYATDRDPADAHAAVAGAGETLAALHQLRTEGFGPLENELRGPEKRLGSWFVDALIPKVEDARDIDPDSGGVLDRAFDMLASHRAVLDASLPGLVHGDFSPANVLVDDGGQVSGVIDWEAVKSGPPELDIGWWDCFFDAPATPTASLVAGHERLAPFDPARLSALRHLTVIRVMIGHFTWARSVGDRSGIRTAAERLRLEVSDANAWSLA